MTDRVRTTVRTALPTKRVLALGVVALALVAAGCGGGGGGGDTTTAAPAEETPTDEATATTAVATTAETTTEGTTTSEATTTESTTVGTTTNGSGNTTLAITVVNNTSAPVENATVQISDESGGILEGIFGGGGDAANPGAVGPNGEVTVELPTGNYTVEATADGFVPATREVQINGTDANITLTLNETPATTPVPQTLPGNATPVGNVTPPGNATPVGPGVPANVTPVGEQPQYTLNITIEDGTGAPVPNASVQVSDEGGLLSGLFGEDQDAGAVNSEGVVSVELSNGTYIVRATAEGFAEAEQDVEINGSGANVTLALNETTTTSA